MSKEIHIMIQYLQDIREEGKKIYPDGPFQRRFEYTGTIKEAKAWVDAHDGKKGVKVLGVYDIFDVQMYQRDLADGVHAWKPDDLRNEEIYKMLQSDC